MLKFIRLISIIAIALVSITANGQSSSQDYNTAIGVRLGGLTSGLTVKHFVNREAAIEGIASFAHRAFILTGLYEVHKDINNAPGLKWLYGGGAHLGFFRYDGYYYAYHYHGNGYYYVDEPGSTSTVFGLDFIIGMDYKFNNAPINIGLDLKPFVDFVDGASGYFDGALSFRFAF